MLTSDEMTALANAARRAARPLDEQAVTVAHVAVEDVLVTMRDDRVSVLGPGNGLVILERDGGPSSVMRMGTREALEIGIRAFLQAVPITSRERLPKDLLPTLAALPVRAHLDTGACGRGACPVCSENDEATVRATLANLAANGWVIVPPP